MIVTRVFQFPDYNFRRGYGCSGNSSAVLSFGRDQTERSGSQLWIDSVQNFVRQVAGKSLWLSFLVATAASGCVFQSCKIFYERFRSVAGRRIETPCPNRIRLVEDDIKALRKSVVTYCAILPEFNGKHILLFGKTLPELWFSKRKPDFASFRLPGFNRAFTIKVLIDVLQPSFVFFPEFIAFCPGSRVAIFPKAFNKFFAIFIVFQAQKSMALII